MQNKVVDLQEVQRAHLEYEGRLQHGDVGNYILDMIRQLSGLAAAHGEPLLGEMLDEVRRRHDRARTPTHRSRET